jgi:hypothetical protein
VIVVSSRLNKQNMSDLEYEKAIRSGNMYGDEALLQTVTEWRKPEVVFESFAEVDLGGRTVQLWHSALATVLVTQSSMSQTFARLGQATILSARASDRCCCRAVRIRIWRRYG